MKIPYKEILILSCLCLPLWVFIACWVWAQYLIGPAMCGNQVLEEVPSPDGRMRAVIFERDCGATTDFSTQVSILPQSSKLPNEAGNVFIGGPRGTAHGKGGGPEVHAEWTSPDNLTIRYDPVGEVFLKNDRMSKVEINYDGLAPDSHQN